MKKVVFTIILATVLWTVMFSPLTAPHVNFWWTMTASAVLLSLLSTLFRPDWWRGIRISFGELLLGVAIAVGLWLVFWVGDKMSQLLFDFARPQVDSIYGMKAGESPWLLTLLMLFIIGPAEEIFWRGYVQRSLSERINPNMGFVVTTAVYALVHAGSCNFMLTMAALVAGAAWGLLYRLFPRHFGAIILSHALWDVAVFVWFPI
ncbi:MAG: CPBP family intramembrane metalloprotease [Bacteroidaceae bacterium]|nr:CPBP family intramembrane metalloprotease [Bacteroidaceae bacterium]